MPRAAQVHSLHQSHASTTERDALAGLPAPPRASTTLAGAKMSYFVRMMLADRWSGETAKRQELDLGLFVRLDPSCPIADVGLSHIWRWLGAVAHLRLATQRSRFASIVQFLDWCVRKKLLDVNPARLLELDEKPWTSAKGKKQINAGKRQLPNMDAVVQFCRAANTIRDVQTRVAVQLLLLCGMRSGEVRNLRAGDVDVLLGRIWVRPCDDDTDGPAEAWDVKTASSRRTVTLPALLRSDLERLCKGKATTQLLFPRPRAAKRGVMRHANWLIKAVGRVCDAAGLRRVCPHGLRGTWASIQAAKGSGLADISVELGHAAYGGQRVLKEHYLGTPQHADALEPPEIATPNAA